MGVGECPPSCFRPCVGACPAVPPFSRRSALPHTLCRHLPRVRAPKAVHSRRLGLLQSLCPLGGFRGSFPAVCGAAAGSRAPFHVRGCPHRANGCWEWRNSGRDGLERRCMPVTGSRHPAAPGQRDGGVASAWRPSVRSYSGFSDAMLCISVVSTAGRWVAVVWRPGQAGIVVCCLPSCFPLPLPFLLLAFFVFPPRFTPLSHPPSHSHTTHQLRTTTPSD